MKGSCTKDLILVIALAFGISFVVLPQCIAAQDDKQKPPAESKEKKQDLDDDEGDEDDDRVTREEAQSVKVPLESARAIALAKIPGTVLDEELEKERGRLQYAFDIKDSEGKVFDVEIDAETGEVLQAIEEEDDDDEDDEVDSAKSKEVKKKRLIEKTSKFVMTKPN